jgi:hypothetical protein
MTNKTSGGGSHHTKQNGYTCARTGVPNKKEVPFAAALKAELCTSEGENVFFLLDSDATTWLISG